MTTSELPGLGALAHKPMPVDVALSQPGLPASPGLYALHGSPETWRELGLGDPPDDRPLYVGKAERSLAGRVARTHFATGRTGSSSLRRSLAALLAANGRLQLQAIPRRPADPEPCRWDRFTLEDASERKLTEWMRSSLLLALWKAPDGEDLRRIEDALVRQLEPPLNVTLVRTRWTDLVKSARAQLAEQTRDWARERGLDV